MKFFGLCASLLLLVPKATAEVCASDCRVPIPTRSCEDLLEQYNFQGSCCMLTEITGTSGCRVTVGGNGNNCFWSPKCTPCDPTGTGDRCGEVFTAQNDPPNDCPTNGIDALTYTRTRAPTPSPAEGATQMPTFEFIPDPTCAPTAAPVEITDEPTAAPSGATSTGMLTTCTAAAMGLVYAAN